MKKFWFKAKTYGYGWYPATWQAWVIMATYILLIGKFFQIIDKYSHSVSDTLIGMVIPFLLLTILLLFIAYGTGEKLGWRWGK